MPKIPCLVLFAIFSLPHLQARQWDTPGAAKAFEEASQKRRDIAQAAQPDPGQYLQCAQAYRKVYLKNPHYGRAGDAIYEEGRMYQEMGDRFTNPGYYRTAVKRFHFLVMDYSHNPNCPDALLRMAAIYSTNLGDENAAQDAYQRLRTQYRYSSAALEQIRKETASIQAEPQAALVSTSVPKPPATVAASVQSIRYWSTSEYTRVIVDMDFDAPYQKTRLQHPDRLCLDISNARLGAGFSNRSIAVADDLLIQVRAAQNRPDVVRIVLDFSSVGDYEVSELHDPFRIVVDLHRHQGAATGFKPATQGSAPRPDEAARNASREGSAAGPVASKSTKPAIPPAAVTQIEPFVPERKKQAPSSVEAAGKQGAIPKAVAVAKPAPATLPGIAAPPKPSVPTSRGDRTLTRTLGLKIGRIVIDPGHGGHDLGTVGPGGLLEKNLVLAVALALQKQLQEKIGAEVILTRDDDTFISLEERTAMANRHRADLFISIHANASRQRSTSGVETYFLAFAKTEAEREIAARENATTLGNVRDLENLIEKIAKADKSAESRELASIVQARLYSGLRKLFPSAKNRGVRSAPFVVLIGANMPSVLAEVAFISNPRDEKLLKRKTNQELLAKALFSGIDAYMKTLGSNVVQNQAIPR